MIKEFDIRDILNAVDKISKIGKKKSKISEKKYTNDEDDALILNNQVKMNKSEVLVLDLMIDLHREKKATIILVTHETDVAQKAERIIVMGDGKIIKDSAPAI